MSPLYTMCLVCNIQLTKVIIVFPSNKWVALTEPVDVLCACVVDCLSGKQHQKSCISQLVRRHYLGAVGETITINVFFSVLFSLTNGGRSL